MHVQASDPPLCKSWRHPAGDGTHYFRNDYAEELIKAVNESGDEASLNALLLHCEPLLRSQFEYRASTKFVPIDELLSSARLKLWRSLHLFDPARGTAFSFVSRVGSSVGMSLVGERWKETDRRAELSDCAFNRLPATDDSQHGAEDIADRIRRETRTSCTDESELAAQRWMVLSFIDAAFVLRRWETANSCMQVFGRDELPDQDSSHGK